MDVLAIVVVVVGTGLDSVLMELERSTDDEERGTVLVSLSDVEVEILVADEECKNSHKEP